MEARYVVISRKYLSLELRRANYYNFSSKNANDKAMKIMKIKQDSF